MPSCPAPPTSAPSPDDQTDDASAVELPVRTAVPLDTPMDVDPPSSPPAVDVHPKSQPDGDTSNAVPVSGTGPEAGIDPGILAVPATYVVDNVAIGESTSVEPTSPVKKTTTPPGSDEAANAAIALPTQSAKVDRSDNQPIKKAITPPDSDEAVTSATVFTHLDPDKAATSAVVLPVQADEVDQPVHQPESVELFSRIDCENDPGE
jgi:hypothetical protein